MQSCPDVGFPESYSSLLCPYCCSFPSPFPAELWLGVWSGARRDKATPGPKQDKSGQTLIAKAQLRILFPVGKELAKVFFIKLSACDFP